MSELKVVRLDPDKPWNRIQKQAAVGNIKALQCQVLELQKFIADLGDQMIKLGTKLVPHD